MSVPQLEVICRQNRRMARPLKDPTGAELARLNLNVQARFKAAAKAKAQTHGMTLTDYLEGLIAADISDLQAATGIQEALIPKSA